MRSRRRTKTTKSSRPPSGGADDRRVLLSGHVVCIPDDTAWIEQRVFGFLGLDTVPREVVDVGLVPVKQR
jgi:hypothetical protein